MKSHYIKAINPVPFPSGSEFHRAFQQAKGSTDPKVQLQLQKEMGLGYRQGIGELTYAMVTCRPDLSHSVVKCAQHSACPSDKHYHAIKHVFKFLHHTKFDDIHYWSLSPNDSLANVPLPTINSSKVDLNLKGCPHHDPLDPHAYTDSDWATCTKTRRSFSGACICLAGGVIVYKTKLQPTVDLSSTEAEIMAFCD